jgi:hypothetical protein
MTTSDVSSRNKLSPDHNGVHHRKPKPTASSMLDPSSDSVHVRKRDHVSVISDEDRQEMGQSSYSTDSKTVDDQKAQTLSASDVPNFILLVILYLLQGIPVGLSFGSIPFLLKAKMSYSEIAIFSLSSWPYSLKLLWSPIVDAIYWPELGRRKSWIIPIQILTGLLFLALGWHIDAIMAEVKYFLQLDLDALHWAPTNRGFRCRIISISILLPLFSWSLYSFAQLRVSNFGMHIPGSSQRNYLQLLSPSPYAYANLVMNHFVANFQILLSMVGL